MHGLRHAPLEGRSSGWSFCLAERALRGSGFLLGSQPCATCVLGAERSRAPLALMLPSPFLRLLRLLRSLHLHLATARLCVRSRAIRAPQLDLRRMDQIRWQTGATRRRGAVGRTRSTGAEALFRCTVSTSHTAGIACSSVDTLLNPHSFGRSGSPHRFSNRALSTEATRGLCAA
eukprot:COSAG04_NODE_190_length_20948_cov_7.298863_8_plen_175_part_00